MINTPYTHFRNIVISAFAFGFLTMIGYFWWQMKSEERNNDPKYAILAIAQKNMQREKLPTSYFAEQLNLSEDQSQNLYSFDIEAAREKLLATPFIEKVSLEKIPPHVLYIEYRIRNPMAFVADFSQIACDAKGHLFPIEPFYTPKYLPQIYLGISVEQKLDGKRFELAKELIKAFNIGQTQIQWIDVSNADSESFARREIVVMIEETQDCGNEITKTPILLRLSSDHYQQGIESYQSLRQSMLKEEQLQVIDLRIQKMALIK